VQEQLPNVLIANQLESQRQFRLNQSFPNANHYPTDPSRVGMDFRVLIDFSGVKQPVIFWCLLGIVALA
jgi:hypothetical protein